MFQKLWLFPALLATTSLLYPQASGTASRRGDLKVGAGFTSLNSDYETSRFNGALAYADFDFTRHLGVEAEFHLAHDSSGSGEYEKTYEIGGRYFRSYGRLVPYVKVLAGRGVYNFTEPYQTTPGSPVLYLPVANLAYNLAAGGIGADYKVLPHLYIRGDWEYQRWIHFLGSSLSPGLLSVGAAYRFR